MQISLFIEDIFDSKSVIKIWSMIFQKWDVEIEGRLELFNNKKQSVLVTLGFHYSLSAILKAGSASASKNHGVEKTKDDGNDDDDDYDSSWLVMFGFLSLIISSLIIIYFH